MPHDLTFALRLLGRLFHTSGPPLALFWALMLLGVTAPSPLAAAIGLHLVLRVLGNLRAYDGPDLPFTPVVLAALAATPVVVLFLPDGILMTLWAAWHVGSGLSLLRSDDVRWLRRRMMKPGHGAPHHLDGQAVALIAAGGIGLMLARLGDPALFLTGLVLAHAAATLTLALWLATRERP